MVTTGGYVVNKLPQQQQHQKITNDLTDAVSRVVKMMEADFPQQFKKTFSLADNLNEFKNRIYARAKKREILGAVLVSSYDDLVEENMSFMPSGNDIFIRAGEIKKTRAREGAENERIKELNEIEKKPVTCNPIKLIADTMKLVKGSKGEELRLNRLKLAVLDNNRLIAMIPTPYADEYHLCGFGGCRRAGALAGSTAGSESWYCAKHFKHTA